MKENIIDKVKGKSLYVNLIATIKDNEAIALLLKDKENKIKNNGGRQSKEDMMKYSQYCKLDLKYGLLNVAAFDRLSRGVYYGRITKEDIKTNEEVINSYKEYLIELRDKREYALHEAQRKLQECEDMLDFMEGDI